MLRASYHDGLSAPAAVLRPVTFVAVAGACMRVCMATEWNRVRRLRAANSPHCCRSWPRARTSSVPPRSLKQESSRCNDSYTSGCEALTTSLSERFQQTPGAAAGSTLILDDRATLSAHTHQPSVPRQPYLAAAPRPARALSASPACTQLHTNGSRRLPVPGYAGKGRFEALTRDLTETHPCCMAQHPLHP